MCFLKYSIGAFFFHVKYIYFCQSVQFETSSLKKKCISARDGLDIWLSDISDYRAGYQYYLTISGKDKFLIIRILNDGLFFTWFIQLNSTRQH